MPVRPLVLPAEAPAIRVRGARTHNLKNIDLDIPKPPDAQRIGRAV